MTAVIKYFCPLFFVFSFSLPTDEEPSVRIETVLFIDYNRYSGKSYKIIYMPSEYLNQRNTKTAELTVTLVIQYYT